MKELQETHNEKGFCFMDVAKRLVNEKWKDQPKNNTDLFIISEFFTRLYKSDAYYSSPDFNRFSLT
jgi:hypothetical protein